MLEDCCISFSDSSPIEVAHDNWDKYGLKHKMTTTYTPWHLNPEYRCFKTESLLSKNKEYPSGLIIVDEKGKPHKYECRG